MSNCVAGMARWMSSFPYSRFEPSEPLVREIFGGFVGPDFVRQNQQARSFVRALDEAFKPIATLCHGPWLLISVGCARGRRLASWPGVRDDIVNTGGIWRDEPLVRDRNWVSSRSPADPTRCGRWIFLARMSRSTLPSSRRVSP